MGRYLAVVRMTGTDAFRVELPDFPGVARTCSAVVDALKEADRVVSETVADAARRGEAPAEPTTKQDLEGLPEYRSTFVVRVEVP